MSLFTLYRTGEHLVAGVVAQGVLVAYRWVGRVMAEGGARLIELMLLQLAPHVARRSELETLRSVVVTQLVTPAIGVAARALGDIDKGEGAKGVDGHTAAAFRQLTAYLVEYCSSDNLYRCAADATALHDGREELLLGEVWFRIFLHFFVVLISVKRVGQNCVFCPQRFLGSCGVH